MLFKFMGKEKIELGGITALSMSQGNQKTVMALIWRYIQQYDLAVVIPGLDSHGGVDGLMKWVQPRTQQWYPGLNDFTKDWKDGVAFLSLYDSVCPGEIDMASVSHDSSQHYDNLKRAFDLFEDKFAIPQLLQPEDVTGKYDTKKGNVTYIIMIRNAIEKYQKDTEARKKLEEEAKKDK